MHRTLRRLITGVLLVALPALGSVAIAPAAQAHPDHESALDWSNYEKVTLSKDTGEPIDLAVLPDSRVLHTARNGDLRMTDPGTGVTKVINHIDVYQNSEMGLQTVTLDPDFATNKWVYLYYSPPLNTPAGSAPEKLPAGQTDAYWKQWEGYDSLARFKWTGDKLDLSTAQEIIRIGTNRGQCCHVAGDVDFDSHGNLYLSTGGNTPASGPNVNGYTPINDAAGYNPGLDERRGSGNTNDLRGKILRIDVQEDGSYTIPEGNLFEPGTAKTRPEIFVMGLRNPFRLAVDRETDAVMWGDYGPDAGNADPNRGPMGYVEWNTTSKALNSGWPFCVGDNTHPYRDFDFATLTPGPAFDCAAPVNDSRWNTGLTELPAAAPATLWYGDRDTDQPWPELTAFRGPGGPGGQAPMGGPVYHYDADNTSPGKFPKYWDGKAFLAEFSQDYVAALTLEGPDGPVSKLENFLPNSERSQNGIPPWDNPMDIEFGPDGSLYVLDYGDGFFRQNPDAGLYRIDYAEGNKAPTAVIKADRTSGQAPLTVAFSATGSSDPENGELTYQWDLDGDGTFDATGPTVTRTYPENGQFQARLKVSDPQGKSGLSSRQITVGNTAPTIRITSPPDGGFFSWGDAVPYAISVEDPEDGNTPDCAKAAWTFGLGHNQHGHPVNSGTGCTGGIATPTDAGHGDTENVFGVLGITYTDKGSGGVPPATSDAQVVLNPALMQGEHYDSAQGVTITDDPTASGQRKLTSFDAGDWIAYDPVSFAGINGVKTRASGSGTLALRWGSADAEPFATVPVAGADGWQTVTTDLSKAPSGSGELFVTSSGGVELDSLTFQGAGVADKTAPKVTATLNPPRPNGDEGWYTSNVSLTVSATDNGTVASRQYSVDDGKTWQSANAVVTLSKEGATTVRYRATDNGGNVSEAGSLTVRIDRTGPTVTATGLDAGVHGDSTRPIPVFSAADDISGGATATATLDGKAVTSGQAQELWRLPLGNHDLTVKARDRAGNTTTKTVAFTTRTSYADIRALITHLRADGLITAQGQQRLTVRLGQAEAHADAGRTSQAAAVLESFADYTADTALVSDSAAAAALARDARALRTGATG
ncbi:glucose/arabinose dehydrogenase [Streptomyces brevispora]|uniref:Glucose/arabinose dehydrogenase n=1 Tax=Streptomyces brevispora TaxID=887462 RepID=A0A561V699_9ACTN|nr:PQQ-dependent sugar dehydrogenase [Streptomyces brevispora]TWG07142.1 glucose/arabinose dehydrogenase [Streptomyces brevispora]